MGKVRVLCYHRVENISGDFNMLAVKPKNFIEQMDYLKRNYEILRLEDINKNTKIGGQNAVVVTFDDGYYDLLSQAYPVLEKYGIPATMFISTGNIGTGRENWTDSILRALFDYAVYREYFKLEDDWVNGRWFTRSMQERLELYMVIRDIFRHCSGKKKRVYEQKILSWAGLTLEKGRNDRRMLNIQELKTLSQKPLLSIGSHTVTHPSLKWLSLEEQEYEILESKKSIERITGQEVNLFAYPFGSKDDYTKDTINLLKKAGFEKAVTTQHNGIGSQTDCFEIPRYCVRNYDADGFGRFMKQTVFGEEPEERQEKVPKDKESSICYIGKLETDRILLDGNQKIVIWGSGYWGMDLYQCLERYQISYRVVAFGDNDCGKTGTDRYGVPVIGMEGILPLFFNEPTVILVKGRYDWEICMQLMEKGIGNLHLILRE